MGITFNQEFDLSITSTGQDSVIQISELGHPNDDPVILLDENSGLIGAPEITHFGVNLKALSQPKIRPGTLLDVVSKNTENYGRNFTSQTVTHTGDTWGVPNFTTVEALFFPPRFIQAE